MADAGPPGFGPVWKALRGDAAQVEITLARVQQAISGFAFLIALYFAGMVHPELGLSLAAFAGWAFLWFTVSHMSMVRGYAIEVFAWVNPLVEILIPGYALILLTRFEGPDYALGSWLPPQMYALFIAASILRLRKELPLLMGAAAALQYAAVYWFAIRPGVEDNAALWAGDEVQLVRMFTLFLIGIAGSGAVVIFRRMVDRAVGSVREKELFGKYLLGRQIAAGGMGTVFEATYCPEGGFQRQVAVKRIHPHLVSNQAFLGRFRDEAALCSRLVHPNIVAALDFGRESDSYFFAMEFIDGLTLMEVLKHRILVGTPLEPRVVCWLARQVLEGLHFAHAVARDADGAVLHVVHRDLSPHNILLDRSGLVKISDFGVARAMRDAHDVHSRNLVGKPSYMAPEQLRKVAMDERADLFSMGVMVWEALTNRRLFFRDNEAATMLAVLEVTAPPPSQLVPSLGPHWDAFCGQALAKQPDVRFQSAAGMLAALAKIQELEGAAGPEDASRLVAESDEDALPELEMEA